MSSQKAGAAGVMGGIYEAALKLELWPAALILISDPERAVQMQAERLARAIGLT